MKHSIYLALIGSLVLAVNARAADQEKPQKKAHAGHGAASVQKASIKGGGPAKVHGNSNAMHAQRNPANSSHNNTVVMHQNKSAAVVHQNKIHSNSTSAMRHGNVNATAVQHNTAKNQYRNANIARAQNASISHQQNVTVNRHQNAAITNNWSGSRFQRAAIFGLPGLPS